MMMHHEEDAVIRDFNDEVFFKVLAGRLGEREARLVTAAAGRAVARQARSIVTKSSGLSASLVRKGDRELDSRPV